MQIPGALRSERWRRRIWRWPTATPPNVAPTSPPVFVESGAADPGSAERLWVRLPSWIVADGERPEPLIGAVLGSLGVRAVAAELRGASESDGVRADCGVSQRYDITGRVDDIRNIALEKNFGGGRMINEFRLSAPGLAVLVQTDAELSPGSRVTVSCQLAVVGDYEWEAFQLPDIRANWLVCDVSREGADVMLLLEQVRG